MKKLLFAFLLISTSLLAACTPNGSIGGNGENGGNGASGEYDELAKCLTEKGVVMYGAYWCGHCDNQKAAFGDSFQYITYVECDPAGPDGNREACLQAGVEAYPTWGFPGQDNFVGEQPLEDLAKAANCDDALPQAEVMMEEPRDFPVTDEVTGQEVGSVTVEQIPIEQE